VTNYHMVIEGTLALTGQHFMLDYYENNDLLPGFAEGFSNIARDEHRHVAYGTWFLQQKCGEERDDDYEFFGYTSQEQAEFAYSALARRLKVIGVRLPSTSASPSAA
jgi:ribonucleoside-diphosphate reductase beta chain